MFSFISMNWRGRPLESYRTIVELIAATTTKKGLRIRAERDEGYYETGVKISDKEARCPAPHPARVPRGLELHAHPEDCSLKRAVSPNQRTV